MEDQVAGENSLQSGLRPSSREGRLGFAVHLAGATGIIMDFSGIILPFSRSCLVFSIIPSIYK